ncbi:MAG TPA: glucokinase, partial [Asticcacaulis sp.]
MTAYVLLCDFTFGSYIRLALAEAGRRPEPPSLRACADRAGFDAQVMGFLADHGHPRLIGAALSTRGWETHGVLHLPDEGMHLTRDNVRGL